MTKQFYTIGSLDLSKQTSLHRCMHTYTDAKTADNKNIFGKLVWVWLFRGVIVMRS